MKPFLFQACFFTVLFLFCAITGTKAKNSLYIVKPNGMQHKSSILKAELDIKPQGAYVEYTLHLQVGRNTAYSKYYTSNLSLMFHFELDEYTFITDAKYWRNNEVHEAEIRSRLTTTNAAGAPYFKLIRENDEQYFLSMYPLRISDMKEFQLTYWSPARIQNKHLIPDIPIQMLFAADSPPEELSIRIFESVNYQNLVLSDPAITWKTENRGSEGTCLSTRILKPGKEQLEFKLALKKPDEMLSSVFEDETGGYYALHVPVSLLSKPHEVPRKTCYLFDLIKTEQSPYIPIDELMELCAQGLKHQSEGSMFNVINSGLTPEVLNNNWVDYSPESIEKAFRDITLPTYSNLNGLLQGSIDFINSQGGDGEIVLFTNNNRYRANNLGLADELRQKLQDKIPIHIIDCAQNPEHYYHTEDKPLVNSALFYQQLAANEGSSYAQMLEWDAWRYQADYYRNKLLEIIHRNSGICVDNFNLQSNNKTTGIFAEFHPNTLPGQYYLSDDYFISIGRYNGEKPSDFLLNYEIKQAPFSKSMEVKDVRENHSTLKTIWLEYYLSVLEKTEKTYHFRSDIVAEMMELGILGKYTAYMSSDWGETLCIDCFTLINEPIIPKYQPKVSPNPFSDFTSIDTKSGFDLLLDLKLFDMHGKQVKTFHTDSFQQVYEWDGCDDYGKHLQPGIYLLHATYLDEVICLKIVKR